MRRPRSDLKKPVEFAAAMHDRKLQRALKKFFKPENWFTVHGALLEVEQGDPIGAGCECRSPIDAPKDGLEARRRQ